MIMKTSQSRIQEILGHISLVFVAITIVASGAVVMLPSLIPAWVSWSIALGSTFVVVTVLSAIFSLRFTSFALR